MSVKSYEKIAKILRTDKDVIRILEEKLSETTGKQNVMDKIIEQNEEAMARCFDVLYLTKDSSARDIYNALIRKIEIDNKSLMDFLGNPLVVKTKEWQKLLDLAYKLTKNSKGFFLKTEKAKEFLKNCPPQKVLKTLEYRSVDEMLANEDIFEVFSALRFIEGSEWLNNVFFKQYKDLKPSDFEYREITTRALSKKIAILGRDFIKHKHHNISHLKELGVIFVIPYSFGTPGEIIRNFGLILHYFNEVPFYSSLSEKFAKNEENFAENLVSLLRGDVLDEPLPKSDKTQWLIIQRYLAKDDENDWRLFVPHIDPESLHWERAGRMLVESCVCEEMKDVEADFSFWRDLDWVGDYFPSDVGIDVLVSFNLIDTAMSLVEKKEFVKYLYHHQESLWNKIFKEYFSEEKLEEFAKDNIIKGYFEI